VREPINLQLGGGLQGGATCLTNESQLSRAASTRCLGSLVAGILRDQNPAVYQEALLQVLAAGNRCFALFGPGRLD